MKKVYVVSRITEKELIIISVFETFKLAKECCELLFNGRKTKILCNGRLYVSLENNEDYSYQIQEHLVLGSK